MQIHFSMFYNLLYIKASAFFCINPIVGGRQWHTKVGGQREPLTPAGKICKHWSFTKSLLIVITQSRLTFSWFYYCS